MVHEVEVIASSAHEAAALGYRQLLNDGWSTKAADDALFIWVELPTPPVRHKVSVERLKAYGSSAGKPKEIAERSRVKAILEGRNT